MSSASEVSAAAFLADRPPDIHRPTPWHRYAHHTRMLRSSLRTLAGELVPDGAGRILDYGCAELPYRDFFAAHADYVAADLPGNPRATLELNPDGTVPAPDQSFDAVLSTQVLEHVADPAVYLQECHRVLRPGGRLLLSTHGFFVYHADPVDYWRWTGPGLRHAVTRAGFELLRFEGVVGLLPSGLQLIQDSFYWRLPRRLRPLLALIVQSLVALTDRLYTPAGRSDDAQVFALVAQRA